MTSEPNDYDGLVMRPSVPQLNIEDYGGPKHLELIKMYKVAINKVMEQRRKQLFKGVGRNSPCPCGSGVKFKKCHGAMT